jgi:beta-glucosidase
MKTLIASFGILLVSAHLFAQVPTTPGDTLTRSRADSLKTVSTPVPVQGTAAPVDTLAKLRADSLLNAATPVSVRDTTTSPDSLTRARVDSLLTVPAADSAQRIAPTPENPTERRIDTLLSQMTLEEKVGQLNQLPGAGDDASGRIMQAEQDSMIAQGLVGSMLNVTGTARTRRLQEIAVNKSRLHIPLLFGLDVIHGYRTILPIPLAEGCSWDPEAVEQAERMAAEEASAAGIHWTFAPMVDIARDPRWGRIAEGSGEDPYLGSVMAAARVRGFQGNNLRDSTSILACAKHYAAYGAAEAGRDYNTVDISERTLREVYLPPFHAAVHAGAGSLMSSFNEIGGIPSTANRHLLTDILRDEWKFNGFVVSDWGAIGELRNHGIAADTADCARRALLAGVDMDMASRSFLLGLPGLVRSGAVPESLVDLSVRHILREKFALGLFDNPYRNCDSLRERDAFLRRASRRLARQIAGESIVLLKNDGGILPLQPGLRSVALIGPLVDNIAAPLGPWSGAGRPQDVISLLTGVGRRLGPSSRLLYAEGCNIENSSTSGFQEAVDVARKADVVIMALGENARMSGEGASRSSIGLPGVQEDLLKAVVATGKPVVVVLMNGRPLTIPWIAENVHALVEGWFLGVESGNALADVLFGDVNPSGKLCATFPRSVGQIPIYYNHKNTGRPIVESDRFTSRYLDSPNTPLFPFGYGLSYTKFAYSNLRVDTVKLGLHDTLHVSVDLKNVGRRPGAEVVQLYVHDEVASVTRPVRELKAFKRVMLGGGKQETVTLAVPVSELGFYDENMKYTVEPGKFQLFVGGNSVDTIAGEFEVTGETGSR